MNRFASHAVVALSCAALSAALVAPGAAGAATSQRRLKVTSFTQDAVSGVLRNETLEFRFSTRVRRGSVDDQTVRVVTADDVPVVGALSVQGHVVRFDPTRTQQNYDASLAPGAVVEPDLPAGFAANTVFAVTIPGAPERHTVRSARGRLPQTFSSLFTTGTHYRDLVAGPPSHVGNPGPGLFAFDPPRDGASGLIAENAALVLEFSEPIEIATLVPGVTVIVARGTEPVIGTIREDPAAHNGRRFRFEPTSGWGFGDGNTGNLTVNLTTGITDLAGNALSSPVGPGN